MESNLDLEEVVMDVEIEEIKDGQGDKIVSFVVEDLDSIKVELSNSKVEDIKELFDKIFDYIISERKLITFKLKSTGSNLFIEVAHDLVEHLNKEIEQSKENFQKLITIQDEASR